jgi:hypothetical protein
MKNKLQIKSNPAVEAKFNSYPEFVQNQMRSLRALVIETAKEINEIEELEELEETLKWGEPSYINKHGSTLRMDWKEKTPEQYAMYFKCTSRLVETFRMIFDTTFQYEGNRAIVFQLNQPIPKEELKACIKATLLYHKVKKLETLGI